jgi:hypothetical protein
MVVKIYQISIITFQVQPTMFWLRIPREDFCSGSTREKNRANNLPVFYWRKEEIVCRISFKKKKNN